MNHSFGAEFVDASDVAVVGGYKYYGGPVWFGGHMVVIPIYEER